MNSNISFETISVQYEDDQFVGANTVPTLPLFDALSSASVWAANITLNPGRIVNPGPNRTEYLPDIFRGGSFEVVIDGDATIGYRFTIETVAVVPEPASWAMMIAGFGLAGSIMRRRTAAFA